VRSMLERSSLSVGVECRRPAAGAAPLTMSDLIGRFRDGRFDLAVAQPIAVGAGRVGTVGHHPVRALTGPAAAERGNGDGLQ
jgi:hypothetical protein